MSHATLPDSDRTALADARPLGPVDATERIEFTVVLRRRSPLPKDLVDGTRIVSRDELAARFGADPANVDNVKAVFRTAGIAVSDVHIGPRRLSCDGPADAVSALFATELRRTRSTDPRTGQPVEHRSRSGNPGMPSVLDGIVVAVFGLDDRPQAQGNLRRQTPSGQRQESRGRSRSTNRGPRPGTPCSSPRRDGRVGDDQPRHRDQIGVANSSTIHLRIVSDRAAWCGTLAANVQHEVQRHLTTPAVHPTALGDRVIFGSLLPARRLTRSHGPRHDVRE
ncbi:protease pro-enzyme activation domain-containing protein [Kutzneria sp. NPDC051319]|uniref:protease pro-enzyme activation domain-containing protein n=1 Tax=Kutzneria sp. NPDC051319 TaxID=3155047 RepID=UPI00341A862E